MSILSLWSTTVKVAKLQHLPADEKKALMAFAKLHMEALMPIDQRPMEKDYLDNHLFAASIVHFEPQGFSDWLARSHNPRTSCSLGVFDLQSNMAAARFCCAGEV